MTWICQKCTEEHDDQFEWCWKCASHGDMQQSSSLQIDPCNRPPKTATTFIIRLKHFIQTAGVALAVFFVINAVTGHALIYNILGLGFFAGDLFYSPKHKYAVSLETSGLQGFTSTVYAARWYDILPRSILSVSSEDYDQGSYPMVGLNWAPDESKVALHCYGKYVDYIEFDSNNNIIIQDKFSPGLYPGTDQRSLSEYQERIKKRLGPYYLEQAPDRPGSHNYTIREVR
jgi:hypothetical protein